jgi:hypothetical protein
MAKVTLHFDRRPDGGLRVYSDDVPGLVLSHRDASKVFQDLGPALEALLSGLTDQNRHDEVSTGPAVGNEFRGS